MIFLTRLINSCHDEKESRGLKLGMSRLQFQLEAISNAIAPIFYVTRISIISKLYLS